MQPERDPACARHETGLLACVRQYRVCLRSEEPLTFRPHGSASRSPVAFPILLGNWRTPP